MGMVGLGATSYTPDKVTPEPQMLHLLPPLPELVLELAMAGDLQL